MSTDRHPSRRRTAASIALMAALSGLGIGFGMGPGTASAASLDLTKPIKIIVPLTPGGSADAMIRLLADELRSELPGAVVVIENRPGALGAIGTSAVAKAAPDGHTLVLSLAATFAANPSLVKNLSYDPQKDFTHIARLATNGFVLVAGPASGAPSVQALVADGKANPRKLAFGYGTTTTFVASSTFARVAGFEALGVSYQAQPPALNDVLGGQTHFMFADYGLLAPHIQSGRIKALAVSSARRATALPDLPTLDELGYKGFDLGTWVGLSAPAGTPREIVDQLNTALNRLVTRQDLRPKIEALGFDVAPIGPAEFTAYVRATTATWSKSIRDSGVEPQ